MRAQERREERLPTVATPLIIGQQIAALSAMSKSSGLDGVLAGGYDLAKAEAALEAKKGELVAFGRFYLANPDYLARAKAGRPLNTPDFATFYTPGAKGYTDYP
ncbi:MAG: hypothetical protein ABI867_39445 [Kofleriaceae bacterium]